MNTFAFDTLSDENIALFEALLPDCLRPVVSLIGVRLTLDLVANFQGQRVTFPKSESGPGAAAFAEFAQVIGAQAVQTLGGYFDGEMLSVPSCIRLKIAIRNSNMTRDCEELLKCMSFTKAISALVKKYGLCATQVQNILNGK